MFEKYFFEIFIALVFIISLLSTLIYFLVKKLKQQQSLKDSIAQKEQDKEKYILESLEIITKALIQEQCEISEGCIRIRMLLLNCRAIEKDSEEYAIFEELYQKLKMLKTHESRQELSLQERTREDQLRFKLEDEYCKGILAASDRLLKEVKEFL